MSQLLITTKTFADHSAGYCVLQGFSLVLASGAWGAKPVQKAA
jgi:hypothetical protein